MAVGAGKAQYCGCRCIFCEWGEVTRGRDGISITLSRTYKIYSVRLQPHYINYCNAQTFAIAAQSCSLPGAHVGGDGMV